MADVEAREVDRADAMRAVNLQQEISEDCSAQHADGEAGDANARRKQHATDDDSDVVHQRSERRDDEMAFRILHRAENAAFVKTDLRRQHQAREKYRLLQLGGLEARRNVFHQMGGEDFAQDHQA